MDGDKIELTIEKVGTLQFNVKDELKRTWAPHHALAAQGQGRRGRAYPAAQRQVRQVAFPVIPSEAAPSTSLGVNSARRSRGICFVGAATKQVPSRYASLRSAPVGMTGNRTREATVSP